MRSRDPDPFAEALAEALPQLEHPTTGAVVIFAGLGSESMRKTRLQLAESILAWIDQNKPKPARKTAKKPLP